MRRPIQGAESGATMPEPKSDATLRAAVLFGPDVVARSLQTPDGYARRSHLLGAGDFLRHELAFLISVPLHLYGVDFFHLTVLVAGEAAGGGQVNARIIAKFCRGFLLTVIEPINLRPFRPGIVGGAFHGRPGENLDLHQTSAAVTHGRADAVGAGVAAADHDHVIAGCGDKTTGPMSVEAALGIGG